jgi:hypothetical protein
MNTVRVGRRSCVSVLVTGLLCALPASVPALAEASSADPGSAKAAAAPKRRDVRKRLGPAGGLVESRSGAAIYVPPGVMQRRGRVSIKHLKGGRINFHIAAPWRGTIAVTMPRVARSEVVAHSVGDMWLPEGPPGQRTVWVTQLSIFDTAKAKAKAAVCFLQLSKAKIAACLAKKLPGKIGKDLGSWLAEKLGHNCAAALISNGLLAPVATLWEDACAGSAGEGDFQFPGPVKEPSLPVTNAPGGSVQPETVNPQPAAPIPAPTPAPTPPPGPAPAPQVWNEQQGSLGANTFTNPYNASGMGPKIPPMAWVAVSCKVHAPQIASANPDGYWYRIASAPWSNAYYAVANTFWNGDIPGQRPYTHNTDWAVPNC